MRPLLRYYIHGVTYYIPPFTEYWPSSLALLRFTNMMGATKKPGMGEAERRSSRPPEQSEAKLKSAKKWSPTLPSVTAPAQPDALAEAHAHLAEARAALEALVLALDRIKRR